MIIISMILLTILVTYEKDRNVVVGEDTKKLCREYALRDHRKEIGEERFDWLSQYGNPNDVVFFYQSCIGHITGIPSSKEYMK